MFLKFLKINKENTRIFLRFVATGVLEGFIELALITLLMKVLDLWYLYAILTADLLAYSTGFLMRKYLVFKNLDYKKITEQFFIFFYFAVCFLLSDAIIMTILVGKIGLFWIYVKIITIPIFFTFGYLINKFITFKE